MPVVDHKYQAQGAALKAVRCENCPTEYAYQLTRVSESTVSVYVAPFSKDENAMAQARQQAEAALPGILERAVDPVPCPACGWYQADMVPLVRGNFAGWMLLVGVVFIFLGCLMVPVAVLITINPHDPWKSRAAIGGTVACFALGVGLPILRVVRSRRFDPNATDVEARIKLGQALALGHRPLGLGAPPPPPASVTGRRLSAEAIGWLVYFLALAGLSVAALALAGEMAVLVYLLGFFVWALNAALCWGWYEFRRNQLPSDQSPLFASATAPPQPGDEQGTRPWRINLVFWFLGLVVTHAGLILFLGNKSGVFPTFPFAGGLTLVVGIALFGAGFRK